MAYTVYVLYSPNYDRLYIGQTEDLDKRLRQHFAREVKSTKHWLPMSLIYTENVSTRAEAMKREKQLKSRSGRVWLKANCLMAESARKRRISIRRLRRRLSTCGC
ncbi:MAG: GIY-YIG nuclease family protein [Bacteroidota bacterium]